MGKTSELDREQLLTERRYTGWSKITYKISQIFLFFSKVSAHHKWNGARLLSPAVQFTSCLMTCQKI